MQRVGLVLLVCTALPLALAGCAVPRVDPLNVPARTDGPPAPARAAVVGAQLPLYFVANQGQLDPRVAYYVPGRDTTLYFTSAGLTFTLSDREPLATDRGPERASRGVVAVEFDGGDPLVVPEAREPTTAVVSYFKGEPSAWRTGVPTYRELVYPQVWPGIDVVYGGTAGRLKYTFVVAPGADPEQIRVRYRGAAEMSVADNGQLEVRTERGGFREDLPYVYQEVGGHRVEIPSAYRLRPAAGDFVVGFELGVYDPSQPLVLDPAVLVYAGYIGGDQFDQGTGIAVDGQGNVYVTGYAQSPEATFPEVAGPDLTYNGNFDAFVAKVRADGTGLVYAGYIGGSQTDYGNAIAVDGQGNAYVVGETFSQNFPAVVGPGLTPSVNGDAFIAKVNSTGTALLYAGFIAGDGRDAAHGVTVDGSGAAYVAGLTGSSETTFPVAVGPDLTYNGGDVALGDAFIAKVKPDGTSLVYAGYLGGSAGEAAYAVAIEPGCAADCAAYLAGQTNSTESSMPVLVGPDLSFNGGTEDGFVAKVKPDGSGLLYLGYIGGSGTERATAIAVDGQGNAYVAGHVNAPGTGFPSTGGPNLQFGGGFSDGFVAKVNPSGSALVYAGFLGGPDLDRANGVAVDATGSAYVVGAAGPGFPTAEGPDATHNGGFDAFVVKLRPDGSGFVYAGYIGGTGDEEAYAVTVDGQGSAYVTGRTTSSEGSFPVLVGPDVTHNGDSDAFVAKVAFTPGTATPVPTATPTPPRTPTPTTVPTNPATATAAPTATRTATPTAGPTTVPVSIVDFEFQPAQVTINVGDTVRWTSFGFNPHTTTRTGASGWNSPTLGNGQSFSVTFTTPGQFSYFCAVHPFMTGSVTVVGGPPPPAIGGRAFTLQGADDPILTWQAGTQTGGLVIRWSPESGFAFRPSPFNLLPLGASSYTDLDPLPDPTYCYVLLVLGGNPVTLDDVRGISDLLCLYTGAASGAPPGQFRVRLNESNTVTLEWTAPGGQDRYELTRTRFDGSPPAVMPLAGGQTTFSEDTSGLTSCYRLAAFNGASEIGATPRLCGAPGVADINTGAPSLEPLRTRLQQLGRD